MNLDNLPPAPLAIEYDSGMEDCSNGFWEFWDVGGGRFDNETEAEFYALARDAFDVMMRRHWWPVRTPTAPGDTG